jgi:hypothetical protein
MTVAHVAGVPVEELVPLAVASGALLTPWLVAAAGRLPGRRHRPPSE